MSPRKRTSQLPHSTVPATWVSLGIALLKEMIESAQLSWQNATLTSRGVPILFSPLVF